jgi:hypothetical protein
MFDFIEQVRVRYRLGRLVQAMVAEGQSVQAALDAIERALENKTLRFLEEEWLS